MNALTRFESTTPVRYDVMNDMCTEVEARDTNLQEQINVLKGEELVNPSVHTDIRTYIASLKKEHATYVSNTPTLTNITGIPVGITSFFIVVDGKQSSSFGAYYCKITLSDLVDSNVQYVCNVYNNTTYTTWTRIATQTMLQSAIDALNL